MSKKIYYCQITEKLIDLSSTPRTCWPILETFKNNEKMPCFPPIFHENKFSVGTDIFNHFFTTQCTLVEKTIIHLFLKAKH